MRPHAHFVGAKIRTETPKATDDLVIPEPDTVAVEYRLNRLEIPFRWHDDATCTTDRLGDHGSNRFRSLGQNQRFELLRPPGNKLCLRLARVRTAVIVRRPGAQHAQRLKGQLKVRMIGGNGCQRRRSQRHTVVALFPGNDLDAIGLA